MHTTNTRTQTGMRQPHPGATYGGNNAGSIETSLADAIFGPEHGSGRVRTPLRPCRTRNVESGSDWNSGTDNGYEGEPGRGAHSGEGAGTLVPGNAGAGNAGDAILHALPEQGSGKEEQLQHVLSGQASEEAAQETAQEGQEAGQGYGRKTGRAEGRNEPDPEPESGTVAEQKSLFYVPADALMATTRRAKNAPKNTSKTASKAASKTAAKTAARTAAKARARTARTAKPQAGTDATATLSVQGMGQSAGQVGSQAVNPLPAPKVFPRRAPKLLAPARRAVCVATDAPENTSDSVPQSVFEELQDDVREEDLPARAENAPEDMDVEEVPVFTDFRDREAPPIPRLETGVSPDGSLYAIPDAASHFSELARNNPAPEPVSSDNGPHGFNDGRDALGTATLGTAGEIAVRQIAGLRAQFAPTAEERLFGVQRAADQTPGQQGDEDPRFDPAAAQGSVEARQAETQARATDVTPNVTSEDAAPGDVADDGSDTASANDPDGTDGNNRKRSRILLLGLVALCLALAAGYLWTTLSGPEPALRPVKQAAQQAVKQSGRQSGKQSAQPSAQQSAQPSARTSEEAQELAILESLGLGKQEEAGVAEEPAVHLAQGAMDGADATVEPVPASDRDPGQGQAKPQGAHAANAGPKEASGPAEPSEPSDPSGDATLEALRALAMELDAVRTSLSTLDTVLGAMDERTVRVLEGLNTLQSAVQSLQKDLERALLAKEARKARQARSAKAEKGAKASRSTGTVAKAKTQAGRGPAGWRVQGLHEDFAILRDASGRDWKVRAGSTIEDLAIVDIDYAKGRVATSKGDIFLRR